MVSSRFAWTPAVSRAREESDEEDDDEDDTAGVFFGFFDIPLNHATAWLIILVATILAAVACYYLVDATRATATHLGVPAFFVAVILAAAAGKKAAAAIHSDLASEGA